MDNQEKKSNLSEPISKIFDGVQTLAKTDRVVGEPYVVGDTIIVPFMETSLGFGVGAMSGEKEAGGVGCKVSPFACLVIQNGFSKMIGIKNQNSITKALDMIPDMIDKYTLKIQYCDKCNWKEGISEIEFA